MSERATVRVVSSTGDVRADGGQGNPGLPPLDDPRREPESMPPTVAMPPQELEKDLGGEAFITPSADEVVEASGGSLAERMRARFEAISATEEFAVPGWELDNGEPSLIIEAKAFGDRKAFQSGISNEAFIARSTHRLLFVNDDGTREEVPGGWGPQLARMIGVEVVKAADLVALVISKPDPANPARHIPNVAGIGALANQIVTWAHRGKREAEEELGE